jgi:cardiolipin synthase
MVAALVGILLLALVLLVIVIWSIKRHRNPRLAVECDQPLEKLVGSAAGLAGGSLIQGNSVELIENGAFFDVMFDEIRTARATVHFETFLWKDGALGRRLVDALIERRRAGVKVRVLVDAQGGKQMGEDAKRSLCDAGCRLHLHHPLHVRHVGVFNERDHRKLVVVDGRVALVGGQCIVDSWLGDAEDRHHVRDLGVRLRGPAVHSVQSAFSENWVGGTGELMVGDDVFPPLADAGDIAVHVAFVKPEGSPPAVKILYHLVVCIAQKRLWIQNPYFLPDAEAIDALGQAVGRGVDVRVMVPSAQASDFPVVQHAAHHNFDKLLASGVRIYEYGKCLLHQKVMTVDGTWCAIGSSNFDDRSLEVNDEITLGMHDRTVAKRLEEIFQRDLQSCVELDARSWGQRSWLRRAQDSTLFALNELL